MTANKRIKLELKVDSCYSENEIQCMGLLPINNTKMDYLVYELDSRAYFFEKLESKLLRLFCQTSKQSFYL